MTSDLSQLVALGESEGVEFKKSTAERAAAAMTVSAMLNGARGGIVLFGVRDDGSVIGIEVGHETHDRLRNEFRKIDPPFIPEIETRPIDGNRAVLLIRVPGNTGIYKYDGRAYMRFGASTSVMPEGAYQIRLLERMHATTRWENQPAHGVSLDDLDIRELGITIGAAIANGRLTDPGTREPLLLLRGLNLVDSDDRLIHAAIMLFGKPDLLERQYPQSRLRMARFRGVTKSEFVDNRQVVGNIFILYQQSQTFLLEHIRIAGKVEEGSFERTDTPAYPLDALREALANALCHRDYAEPGGAIDLAIYDDRIDIVSSGSLHFGITVEELKTEHQSRPWNPLIAQTLYRRKIIESWGRGTLKMIEGARNVGLATPEFINTNFSFTVRFRAQEYMPPMRVSRNLTDLQRRVLIALRESGPVSSSTLAKLMTADNDQPMILASLQKLRDYGLVESVGERRWARWRLTYSES